METHSIKKMKCISNIYGDKRDRTADPLLARQANAMEIAPTPEITSSDDTMFTKPSVYTAR